MPVTPLSILASAFVMFATATTIAAQKPVVVRELSPPDATSAAHFRGILDVRALANGKVLINDPVSKQLIVVDAGLANGVVSLDSVATNGLGYGLGSQLVPYLADSTLFVDHVASSLVVIDPAGRVARSMAPPNARAVQFLWRYPTGMDANGNLYYRGQFAETYPANPVDGIPVVYPDSAPVLRANLDTRKIDTVATYRVPRNTTYARRKDAAGKDIFVIVNDVVITVDDYAILANGALALVRGHDYHVDIIQPDGKKVSGAKLPFDFKRLTDDDKQKLVDSARTDLETRSAARAAAAAALRGPVVTGEGPRPQALQPPPIEFRPLKEMPDYYPPIRAGAAKADRDGNLWILPTTSAQSKNGELVYDVVNNRAELAYRVRIPAGRSVTGFGKHGVVYLMSKDASGWLLERAHVLSEPSRTTRGQFD